MADIAGYSRLTEAQEIGTVARLTQLRADIIEPAIAAHGGRIIKHTGDGFFAIFDSVGGAFQSAVEIQKAVQRSEVDQQAELRIALRMGLNVGDVMLEPTDVYGNAVNVAARLAGSG